MPRTLGRYELLRSLGRGGMAEVFLARRRGPGGVYKQLVVKRIRRERLGDPRFLELFIEEARLSMSLAHKNIVPMFDFGRVGEELFLVMEYADGRDLGAALQRAQVQHHPLSPVLVAFIGLEACQALEYAHTARDLSGNVRGIVHRDVTPRNVLVSYAGEVKLVDFGIAAKIAKVPEGKVRGTPAYMAPEQARGESIDGRADLFSLGLVLWEAVAGRRAYEGSGAAVIERARRGDVPPLPVSASAELKRVIERATLAAAADRYADARAMQRDLDEYLVSARAAQTVRSPMGHQLGAWLHDLFPQTDGDAESGSNIEFPDGEVVTFLDDGERMVRGGITMTGSFSSIRSVAETVAEDAGPADSAESAPESAGAGTLPSQSATGLSASGLSQTREDTVSTTVASAAPRWWLWPAAVGLVLFGAASAHLLRPALPPAREHPPDRPAAPASAPGALARADDGGARAAAAGGEEQAVGSVVAAPPEPPSRGARPGTDDAESMAGSRGETPAMRRAKTGHVAVLPASGAPAPAAGQGAPRSGGAGRPAAAPGIVRVSARPWAEVRVVGQSIGCTETPCTLEMAPGKYTLVLRNPVAHISKEVHIDVVSGETITVREDLPAAF